MNSIFRNQQSSSGQENTGLTVENILDDMFKDLVFMKKEDIDNKSIYVVQVSDMSTKSDRKYIVLICSLNYKKMSRIKDLFVFSVQTKIMPDYFFRGRSLVWNPGKLGYNVKLHAVGRERGQTKYTTQNEIIDVIIFHNSKKKDLSGKVSQYQYPEKNTLLGALESFSCVVDLKQQQHSIRPEESSFDLLM